MVRSCIPQHIDMHTLEVLREAEQAERTLFYEVPHRMTGR
jgi:hypothetical protein